MFIELETDSNTIQLVNIDNILTVKFVGTNRPIIYLLDGTNFTTGTNKDNFVKLLADKQLI